MRRRAVVVVAAVTVPLAGCLGYGAEFLPPPAPPVPPGAAVVAADTVSDDDDPIRGRVLVLDAPPAGRDALTEAVRAAYPARRGWVDRSPDPTHVCLVSDADPDYAAVVEMRPYGGTRVPVAPGRYLVTTSRVEPGRGRCGVTDGWTPSDLLPPSTSGTPEVVDDHGASNSSSRGGGGQG